MTRTNTSEVELVGEETTLNIARAALFAALMGAFALVAVTVPFTSIPFTLQVLGVFLAGLFLGPLWGFAAMVLYLFAGAVGAPVFEGASAGVGHLLGPTGGYLIAFPIATAVVGVVAHGGLGLRSLDDVSELRLLVAMAAGTVLVYALGVPFLWYNLGLSLETAIVTGAIVFVPVEAAKALAALAIVRSDAIRAE